MNHYLGDLCLLRGDPHQAEDHYQNGLEIAREIGSRKLLVALLSGLGESRLAVGDLKQAEVMKVCKKRVKSA